MNAPIRDQAKQAGADDITRRNVEIASSLLATPPQQFDVEALAQRWLTDDFALHYPGHPPIPFARVWKGRAGFVDFMAAIGREVAIARMDIGRCEGSGDNVYVSGKTYGKAISTGRTYESAWLLVWTFRDERVARMVEYQDTQAIAAAFA